MRNVLGRGARFPFRPDVTGGFARVEGEEAVAQAMRLILSTALGERQLRYELGSELPNLLFEPITGATLARIEDAARRALVEQERRARVESISALPDPDVASKIVLTIAYVILATSRRGNLVFPFYLEER